MPFYGLYVPVKVGDANRNGVNEGEFVFSSKKDALVALKRYKDARLREFDTGDDAVKYAQTGYEVIINKHPEDKSPVAVSESTSQFRMPSRQELVRFKNFIENGDYEEVKKKIWENPRYLVGYGDTPTTLREGCRYNAMHICALFKQAKIAELILKTVSDIKFVELLVGKKDDKICKEIARNLLDYYLNITEKGRNDSPLHLAAKVCCLDMVELLTSYPQCKMMQNKEFYYAHEVVGLRAKSGLMDSMKIRKLCYQPFYVPVLCSVDNTVPPHVGQPFTWNNPPDLKSDPFSPELKIQALAGPMESDAAEKFCRRWKTPPRLGCDPAVSPFSSSSFISPSPDKYPLTPKNLSSGNSPRDGILTLHRRVLFKNQSAHEDDIEEENVKAIVNDIDCALMDKKNGNHIKEISSNDSFTNKVTNTNTNNNNNINNNINNNNYDELEEEFNHNNYEGASTPQKNENSSTRLCPDSLMLQKKKKLFFTYRETRQPESPLNEIYKFTPTKVLTSNDEYNLDNHLAEYYDNDELSLSLTRQDSSILNNDLCDTPGFKERHIKISDVDKGLECIGRELASESDTEWREYWDFLDAFIDIRTDEGLTMLHKYFERRMVNETHISQTADKHSPNISYDKPVNAFKTCNHNISSATNINLINGINCDELPQDKNKPYLCIEKSLQVYAKRITKLFQCNYTEQKKLGDALMFELKRLKSLIISFKEDVRFQLVDFTKVHARIARLVAYFAEVSLELTPDKKEKLSLCLEQSLLKSERIDYYKCFCHHILNIFKSKCVSDLHDILNTEEIICQKDWMHEVSCECDWDANLRRITSRRFRTKVQNNLLNKADFNNAHNLAGDEQQQQQQEPIKEIVDSNINNNLGDEEQEEDQEDGDDEFLDCEDSDKAFESDDCSSIDDDDIFLTPKQYRSIEEFTEIDYNNTPSKESAKKQIFIFGNIPTKRDLDVLNAIFEVPFTKIDYSYPLIAQWKKAVLAFSESEMSEFPTPTIVKKTHALPCLRNALLSKELDRLTITPQKTNGSLINNTENSDLKTNQTLPIKKRLIMSPKLSTKASTSSLANSTITTTSTSFSFCTKASPVRYIPSASAIPAAIIQSKKLKPELNPLELLVSSSQLSIDDNIYN